MKSIHKNSLSDDESRVRLKFGALSATTRGQPLSGQTPLRLSKPDKIYMLTDFLRGGRAVTAPQKSR